MLSFSKCDSTERANEIQELFVRNDRPTFPRFFDRAYRTLSAEGGASWVVTDDSGRVVMHVALFPRTFRGRGRTCHAGMLGDLVADQEYRDFWTPLKMFRRAIADIKREGRVDFLYTDPSPNSVAIAKGAGFTPLGDLRRFVAPTNPLYLTFCGLRGRARRLQTSESAALTLGRGDADIDPLHSSREFRAARTVSFYGTRENGEVAPRSRYVIMRSPKSANGNADGIGMLAAPEGSDTASLVDLLWRDGSIAVQDALHAVARRARAGGFRKMSCVTLEGSGFADALKRYGFVPREVIQPIFWLAVRTPASPPPEASEWMLTSLDGSAW